MSSGNKIAMPVKSKDFSMEEMNSHGVLTPYRMAKDLHSSDSVVQPRITVQSIREANEKKEVLKQLELANALADKLASVGQPEHDGSFLAKHPPTSDPFRPAYPDVSNATDSERGTTIFPNKLIEMLVYGMIRLLLRKIQPVLRHPFHMPLPFSVSSTLDHTLASGIAQVDWEHEIFHPGNLFLKDL